MNKSIASVPRPRFAHEVQQVPLSLPPGKNVGSVVSVSRAPNGDLFLLQDVEWANPRLPKDAQLPPVVHLSSDGKFINAWGGPGQLPAVDGVPQWPEGMDVLECDDEGNIWIGGYGADDNAAIKFSPDGKFLMRLGQRGKRGSSDDTQWMTGPVSFFHDVKNREIFIADGYGDGRRIIAFNSDSGKFTRMWGAYGRKPSDRETDEKEVYGRLSDSPAIPQTFGNPVHKVARAPDGRLCVCDRANNRVQEFELIPGGVRYLREVVIAPGTLVMGAVFDLAFTADGKYMYVADGSNLRVWTIDRETFAILGWTSSAPEKEGTDNISIHRSPLHRIAIEPNGDLLLARTVHGLQRLKYLGVH